MKKFLFALVFVSALSSISDAQVLPVEEVIRSTMTAVTVSCSSSTATLMDSTTTAAGLRGRRFVAFQTQDTANYACVGFNANMTCDSGSIIIPENRAIVSIPLALFKEEQSASEVLNLWCKTSSTTGPSNVTFIQGK